MSHGEGVGTQSPTWTFTHYVGQLETVEMETGNGKWNHQVPIDVIEMYKHLLSINVCVFRVCMYKWYC